MSSHLDNLIEHIPNLMNKKMLDLGSGKGKFILEVKKRGGDIIGLEKKQDYIDYSCKNAATFGYMIEIIKGEGENLPFNDKTFDFINLSEVIEHVEYAEKVMKEAERVLKFGGSVYISAPNRFGLKDPHFNLYFINYMPRSIANLFITLLGQHKNYSGDNGKQRLDEMNYYTFCSFKKIALKNNFILTDIREKRIREFFINNAFLPFIIFFYKFFRFFYFDSFHFLLIKNK